MIGRPRHDVASAGPLIKAVGEAFQVAEEIVAEIELNFARDADHNPSCEKLKNSLRHSYRQKQESIDSEFVRGDRAALQVVDRAPNHQWEKNPNAVMQENAERPPDVGATIFLQVR